MAKTKVTKVDAMRNAMNSQISTLGIKEIGKDGGRANRKFVLNKVMKEANASEASASSAYNTVKKELEEAGTIPKGSLGRSGKKPAKAK